MYIYTHIYVHTVFPVFRVAVSCPSVPFATETTSHGYFLCTNICTHVHAYTVNFDIYIYIHYFFTSTVFPG